MKKFILILATISIAGLSSADIQAPPAEKNTFVRKLSRSISNIFYGISEMPNSYAKTEIDGGTAEFSYATVHGAGKTLARLGYGLYELVTFPFPSYKGTYRAPYEPAVRASTHPATGFMDFPPEVGFVSGVMSNRYQVD